MYKQISIGIAEDHLMFRQCLKSMLVTDESINVLFDVANGQELLDNLKIHQPQVILMDIRMPVMNGEKALEQVVQLYPQVKVIIISMHNSELYVADFIKKGARAFIAKHSDVVEVIKAINSVCNDGYYFNENVSPLLVNEIMRVKKPDPSELTTRERLIIQLLCKEMNASHIGEQLFISTRTVEWHKKNIFDKAGVKSLAGLALFAIKHNIIPNPDDGFN